MAALLPHSEFAVYTIRNAANGKRYVGKTAKGVAQRLERHKCTARAGGQYYFQRAIRKYGPENFDVAGYLGLGENFLAGKTPEEINTALSALEIGLIARLGTTNPANGYNSTEGGEGGIPTEETRAKMSMSARGKKHKPFSPETRAKMSMSARGKKHTFGYVPTPETRAKLSAAARGRKHTPEWRDKMSAAMKGNKYRLGIPHSPEHRARLSAAQKGRKLTPEIRAKMSAAKKGKTFSPEHRANLSAAKLGKSHNLEWRAKIGATLLGKKRGPYKKRIAAPTQPPPLFVA